MHPRLVRWILLIPVLTGAAIAPTPDSSASGSPGTPAATSGIRAYIDPVTGKLLPEPSPAEVGRALPVAGLEPDDSRIEVLALPNGAKGVRFNGQRQATMIATLADDGSLQTRCIESTAALPMAQQASMEDKSHDPH